MSSEPTTTSPASNAEAQLRESLRRCSEETIQAALEFRRTREAKHTLPIVVGILARYVDPEQRPRLVEAGGADLRLIEDLALDSLTMVEIVMLVEEVVEITIANEEVRGLRTVGDIRAFIETKTRPAAGA